MLGSRGDDSVWSSFLRSRREGNETKTFLLLFFFCCCFVNNAFSPAQ